MNKITIEETLSILESKMKFYNRILALIPILILLLFVYPRGTQVLSIAIFVINVGSAYYKMSTVPRYINEYHYNDYKAFQKENFLLGCTQQSYDFFIKSRYFSSDSSGFLEIYRGVVRRIAIIHFSMFVLFFISTIMTF